MPSFLITYWYSMNKANGMQPESHKIVWICHLLRRRRDILVNLFQDEKFFLTIQI